MAETVGQYFEQLLEIENMGEYMLVLGHDQYRGELDSYKHWLPLCTHVAEWLAEWRDEPFCGPVTCANAMNVAAQRLIAQEKLQPPKGWLPTIKTLRALGGMDGWKATAESGA